MALPVEDTRLREAALAYVIELHNELSEENGAPTLGTQNQAVDFILADPELCEAIAAWAAGRGINEATMSPPQRPPRDRLYNRVREYLRSIMEPPVFASPNAPAD